MNATVKKFFIGLGFDFEQSLSKPNLNFSTDSNVLKEKLKNKIFYFQSPNQTNTSFYLVVEPLQDADFNLLRKYLWNENKADLLFYISNSEENILIDLFYSKASPILSINDCKLDTFKPNENDLEKIKKINRWQFESGSFWLNYHTFLKKATQKSIDKELIGVLNVLKSKLFNAVSILEKNKEKIEETVQALIDRTLYIKYLEDNHIINSYFYTHYFKSANIDYKALLQQNKKKDLNKLFKVIHSTFNNSLFDKPHIEDEFLTDEICSLIYQSLNSNLATNQLRLYDFQFNVIPVEFISYIYEIFLSEKQKDNGIYYTPKKLAQLIIDDVIDVGIGKVLDPSSGSGMFLSVAFQKLLENSKERDYKDIEKRIKQRTKLLSENIFGIEKEITAQRFAIFSLSLQLFRDLDPTKIKEYIANQLKEKGKVDLFVNFDLSKNIICANTLNQNEIPFEGKTFDYIVGNPPFFEIKKTEEFSNEISFLNNYKLEVGDKKVKAKDIVGKHQISQCFLLKIKDWSNTNTRFGFVSNSSNFYNDNSKEFQNYFYSNYNIEKIYELSKVKKILFENANESVVSLIFSNQLNAKNKIEYYPVDMGIFSEKPFELLIIQEDKIIELKQKDLKNENIRLRDFLVGNDYDFKIVDRLLTNNVNIDTHKTICNVGIGITSKQVVATSNNITLEQYEKCSKAEKATLIIKFKEKVLSKKLSSQFSIPYLHYNDLNFFTYKASLFLNPKDIIEKSYRRNKEIDFFEGEKLLCSRIVKVINQNNFIPCTFDNKITAFTDSVFVLRIKEKKLYNLFNAIINSNIVSYILNIKLLNRFNDSWAKLNKEALLNIPIPKNLDEDLVKQISKISKDLTEGKYEYDKQIEHKLNELIFDLYDLSFIEKQRIRDYFISKEKVTKTKGELERYKATLIDTISLYFKEKIEIEFSNHNHNPIVAKVFFTKRKGNNPSAEKTAFFMLNEIFEHNPKENFLASQEKIYSNDCVYIIKDNQNVSWTETKAYEDGQDILKHIR